MLHLSFLFINNMLQSQLINQIANRRNITRCRHPTNECQILLGGHGSRAQVCGTLPPSTVEDLGLGVVGVIAHGLAALGEALGPGTFDGGHAAHVLGTLHRAAVDLSGFGTFELLGLDLCEVFEVLLLILLNHL